MIPVLVKRDFMSRVTGTAYIITTVLGILVFVGLSFIPPLMDHFVHSFTPRNIDLVVYEQPTTTSMVPYLQEIGEELGDTRIRTVQGRGLSYGCRRRSYRSLAH